jgi:hypothetical protein
MYTCDKNFLRSLAFRDEKSRLEIIKQCLWEPKTATKRVTVLVLADLHLQIEEGESFADRLNSTREWFGESPSDTHWDALVVAGDLVAGNSLGWVAAQEALGLSDCHSKLRTLHTGAGQQIKDCVSDGQALVVPGNHDVVRVGGVAARRAAMRQMLEQRGPHQLSSFTNHVQTPLSRDGAPASHAPHHAPTLLLLGGDSGVVAIIGMDSNQLAYEAPGMEEPGYIGGDQLEKVKELVDSLKSVFNDRPLFLWTVWHHHLLPVYNTERASKIISAAKNADPCPRDLLSIFDAITIDGRTVVEHCCNWRVSLSVHGHMHAPCIQRLSYSPSTEQVLNVLACPACIAKPDEEHPYVGATLIDIDLERGRAEISIRGYERGSDGGLTHKPQEMRRTFPIPLVSASRVPVGEMRLYHRLGSWRAEGGGEEGLLGAFPGDLPSPRSHLRRAGAERLGRLDPEVSE